METVSTAHFDYRKFAKTERVQAFRQMTASVYDMWPIGNPEAFQVEALGSRVGELVFNDFECSASRFLRTTKHLGEGSDDFLILQAQLSGSELLIMDHGVVRLLPGNIYLRDWAYPFDSTTSAMHIHTIIIPRHRLVSSAVLGEGNPVVSWSISEPGGGLLFTLWANLVARFPGVSADQAGVMCEAFLGFIDGLLGAGNQQELPATLRAMESFLMARLRSDVGAKDLCRHFHISRSSLYRLFESHGGVHAYLNRKRMEHAYADLRQSDPENVRVGEVASSWGYDDASSFSRQFRRQFNQSPSEVIGTGIVEGKSIVSDIRGAGSYSNYMGWLRQASNPIGSVQGT